MSDTNHMFDVSVIDQNLVLTSVETALDVKTISYLQIKRILTLDSMALNHCQKDIDYMFIKVYDNPCEDLLSHFEECYRFISEGVLRGDKVLVHCVAGVSRSATIVISYLMIKYKMSFEDAMAFVRKKRSIVEPNHGFRRQLRLFEQMNRKLDSMNSEFRQFLVECLRYKIRLCRPWITSAESVSSSDDQNICEPLSEYFEKMRNLLPESHCNQRREEVYKCKKCRFYLFREINVFKHSVKAEDRVCDALYVEPLHWMSPYIGHQERGPINCCNCFTKLGNFCWDSVYCQCLQHNGLNCLYFKIDVKKVDSPLIQMTSLSI